MRRIIQLSALALSLSSGAAFADHSHGGHGGAHEGGARVVDHRGGGGGHFQGGGHFEGGGRVEGRRFEGNARFEGRRYEGHSYYGGNGYGYANHRPIYVERPYIRDRYFDYYRRPALIVESYGARDGYNWIAGSWQWDGYEWIWQPGHYQPVVYDYGY